MPAEKHSFVRPGTEAFLSHDASCYRAQVFSTNRLGSTTAAQFGRPSDRHVGRPVSDDRKLLGVLIVVEDITLSLSMKRISWTSQLL